jgi:hypothetical protein
MDNYFRADYIDAGAALDCAALHEAAGNGSNLWHLEGIPHLYRGDNILSGIGLEHTLHRLVDFLNRLVDDVVFAYIDFFLLRQNLCLGKGPHVKADDNCLGRDREIDIAFVNRPGQGLYDMQPDFPGGKFLNGRAE